MHFLHERLIAPSKKTKKLVPNIRLRPLRGFPEALLGHLCKKELRNWFNVMAESHRL